MGQVIDFVRARSMQRPEQANAPTRAAAWPLSPAGYTQHMLEPSWLLWRSLVASYASFWFAPLGIEVKVGETQTRRGSKARRSSGS